MNEWNEKCQAWKRFTWINIVGVPLQFWCLESFKKVAEEMGEFIFMSSSTMSKSRMDVATILVPTFVMPLPEILHCKINGQLVTLKLYENFTDVEMAGDEESDDDSSIGFWSDDDDDVDSSFGKSRHLKSSNAPSFQGFEYSYSPLL